MSKKFFLIVTLTIASLSYTSFSSQAASPSHTRLPPQEFRPSHTNKPSPRKHLTPGECENLSVYMGGGYTLEVDYVNIVGDLTKETLLLGQTINRCAQPGSKVQFYAKPSDYFGYTFVDEKEGITVDCYGTVIFGKPYCNVSIPYKAQ